MNVILYPDSFKGGLSVAGRAVAGRNATLPILCNVHLSADGDSRIAISATDLEIGIRTWVGGKVEAPGI